MAYTPCNSFVNVFSVPSIEEDGDLFYTILITTQTAVKSLGKIKKKSPSLWLRGATRRRGYIYYCIK